VDYTRFYAVSEDFIRGAFRVHALGDIGDPFALTLGEVQPTTPLRFHHDEGTKLKDFVGTTCLLNIVSDRFVDALAPFSGWTTYEVEIYDKTGDLVPGYHGLAITGRSGPIDDDLSPVMVLPPPVPEGKAMPHRIGIRFWPDTWDGSDVFAPEESTWMLVTQPVRDALAAAKLTNVELKRITEIEMLVSSSPEARDSHHHD
jgi:hypothetical protein